MTFPPGTIVEHVELARQERSSYTLVVAVLATPVDSRRCVDLSDGAVYDLSLSYLSCGRWRVVSELEVT